MDGHGNKILKFLSGPFVAGLLVGTCVFAMCVDDAMAQRRGGGGGSRGGGGGGHGGRMAQSSVSGGNRGGGARSSGGGGNRSASGQRGGGGDRSAGSRSSGDRGGGDRTRTSGDRTNNIGSNNNVNIEGRDVNLDVEGGCCGYGGGWGYRHPIAAGVTIGAIAGSVAASYGAYYYALPPSGCTVVVRGGVQYHQCGSAYYSEAMDGDEVVYVSVESP